MKTLVIPDVNDSDIVFRVVNNKENHLFSLLVEKYSEKVRHTCYFLLKRDCLADEYKTEIFALAFEKLASFKNNSSFSTWLYAISKNYCLGKIVEQKNYSKKRCSISDLTDLVEDDDATAESESNYAVLEHAIAQLSQKEQIILHLKYTEGLKIKDIAIKLSMKESAVKMRLTRSKMQLKHLLKQEAA